MFLASDYIKALMALFPSGPIWQRGESSFLYKLHLIFARLLAKISDDAFNLLIEAFPSSADNLLIEWEKTLGLPDICFGQVQTLDERRLAVVQKLIGSNGSSVFYYKSIAKNLGYEIEIKEFACAKAGLLHAGGKSCGKIWDYVWRIDVWPLQYTFFRAGSGRAGDRLRKWQQERLSCVLERLAPAHTILIFKERKQPEPVVPDGALWSEKTGYLLDNGRYLTR